MKRVFIKIENAVKDFLKDEGGAGVIELVLIIVVLVGFVFIFKEQIGTMLNTVFSKINSQAAQIYS